MRKILAIVLTLSLLLTVRTSSYALESATPPLLSQMSEEECVEFVVSNGIEIPEGLRDSEKLGSFIKFIIQSVEKDPTRKFSYSYYPTLQMANNIAALVNEYYEDNGYPLSSASRQSVIALLRYSTPVGSWDNAYEWYNCYAYALGRPVDFIYPGYFSDSQAYDATLSVNEFANLTEDDLYALGYDCVVRSTNYASVGSWDSSFTIICLRKDIVYGSEDFHYMRLENGNWYHKPGTSQILKYNYSAPTSGRWSDEFSFEGVNYSGDVYYTSTIHYFAFRANHTYVSSYAGDEYHSLNQHYYYMHNVCADCGHSEYTWVSTPSDDFPYMLEDARISEDFVLTGE